MVEHDILEASEAMRQQMDYYAHSANTGALIAKLADREPALLACMHGSAWRGDGSEMLRRLAEAVTPTA